MGKCLGYHLVSKSQFRQKVDIAPLCCQQSKYWSLTCSNAKSKSLKYFVRMFVALTITPGSMGLVWWVLFLQSPQISQWDHWTPLKWLWIYSYMFITTHSCLSQHTGHSCLSQHTAVYHNTQLFITTHSCMKSTSKYNIQAKTVTLKFCSNYFY